VLKSFSPELEVQRRWALVQDVRLPYLTVRNAVSGLVVSFLDIDESGPESKLHVNMPGDIATVRELSCWAP
jgi:hypothetical protein